MEPKGFEMNQTKGTFLQNQIFLQFCRSSLAPDGYTIGYISKVVQKNVICLIKWKKGQNALVLQGCLMIC